MDLAPDWLSVVNLILTGVLGWLTLGPQRRTKISLMLDLRETLMHDEKDGYRRLIVQNEGHFPAQGVTVELSDSSSPQGKQTFRIEDLPPGGVEYTALALRGFDDMTFPVAYRDGNNKLTKTRVKITTGFLYSNAEEPEVTGWIDKDRSSSSRSGPWD